MTTDASRPDGTGRAVVRSSRDREVLGPRLARWLSQRLDTAVEVSGLEGTSATGMSSDTILFDAAWEDSGRLRVQRLVARLAPADDDFPVFPSYDMARQARTMSLVAELTDVPVPRVVGAESEETVLGAPFFVMERVDGLVPPDVMPYTFGDNWLFDATRQEQMRLQASTIEVIASLHSIERASERFDFLAYGHQPHGPLRSHVDHARAWYEFAAADGARSELAERGFAWLDDHWPDDEGQTVLSWGDARIGNVLYRDFRPAAVLDWEMAALGPRELDVAWLLVSQSVFQHLAESFGAPGMPHFLRPEQVCASYEELTGHRIEHLDFYTVYCAVQWATVFLRTGMRSVHFGQRQMPSDPEELLHHRELLAELIG